MFLTLCVKCKKDVEPVIETADKKDQAVCPDCDSVLNLTRFAIVQLKANGKTKKEVKVQAAFPVNCDKCKKQVEPKIVKGKVCCAKCDTEISNISAPYRAMILERGNARKE